MFSLRKHFFSIWHGKESKWSLIQILMSHRYLDSFLDKAQSSQSVKINIHLSIDRSITIGKFDLIDIDYIDQSVEIDDALVSFTHLSWFLPVSSMDLYRKTHLFIFSKKMKIDFTPTVNLFTSESQLRVERSNIYHFLKL